MSAPQQLEAGKNAYAEKKYNEAVQLFSRALSSSKGAVETQLVILDLRCQAYSKLGKLDLALQDARHMIHTKRHEATGYLRCSQIENFCGNYSAAQKWLEHGIKQVPHSRQVFESRLAKVKEAAVKHLTFQKRQDPVVSIPLEILQIILSFLQHKEVVVLLRVSRAWRSLLQTLPPLNIEIDFSGTSKRVSYQACNASLRRLCKHARRLDFNLLSSSATKAVHSWLSKFPRLETIEVLRLDQTGVRLDTHVRWRSFAKLKSLHVGSGQRLNSSKMNEVIANCQSLQDVSMCILKEESGCSTQTVLQPQLKHLRIYSEDNVPFTIKPEFCDAYPNLHSLSLNDACVMADVLDLSNLRSLQKLELALRWPYELELNLPESLKVLNCVEKPQSLVTYTFAKAMNLCNLLSVSLQNVWGQYLIDTLESADSPPKPQSIRISNIGQAFLNLKSSQGCHVFEACRQLSLQSDDLTDRDSSTFNKLFPTTETLDLEAPWITGAFIADLVNRPLCRLQQITLKDCYNVSSDISAWLKSKGIKCCIINSLTESKSAHRVRDTW